MASRAPSEEISRTTQSQNDAPSEILAPLRIRLRRARLRSFIGHFVKYKYYAKCKLVSSKSLILANQAFLMKDMINKAAGGDAAFARLSSRLP